MSLAIMDKDREMVEEHLYFIENEYLVNINDLYIPLLENYFNMEASKNPVVSYSNMKSEFIYLNGFELVKKIELYGYEIISLSYEDWVNRVENGENLLMDDKLRYYSIVVFIFIFINYFNVIYSNLIIFLYFSIFIYI